MDTLSVHIMCVHTMAVHTMTAQQAAVHLKAHIAGKVDTVAELKPFEMTELLEGRLQQGVPCVVATAELFGSPVSSTQAACILMYRAGLLISQHEPVIHQLTNPRLTSRFMVTQ